MSLLALFLINCLFLQSPKKKRRKIENKTVENECELIALGSSDGSILLYNVNESVVHSKLVGYFICWSNFCLKPNCIDTFYLYSLLIYY